ncbi:MAG: TetR/AcrR family transcriptional regulator [Proteobacteria bacterium]|nr:TetR/AcrR family transcriptional regulator [Pseudomonadota bacterium]
MSGKRQAIKRNNKESIVKAAMKLFSNKGFEKTRIKDIAQQANVATGTFYNYFPKKEDVILYFIDNQIEKAGKEVDEYDFLEHTAIERIEKIIASYLKATFQNKAFAKVVAQERIGKVGKKSNINEFNMIRRFFKVIEMGKKKNEINKNADAQYIANLIFSVYTTHVITWINGIIKNRNECIKSINHIIKLIFDDLRGNMDG